MNGKNRKIYTCCFCGKSIESNEYDITSFLVISNWDKEDNEQQEQQFFCHLKCLKLKLHRDIPLYLLNLVEE